MSVEVAKHPLTSISSLTMIEFLFVPSPSTTQESIAMEVKILEVLGDMWGRLGSSKKSRFGAIW